MLQAAGAEDGVLHLRDGHAGHALAHKQGLRTLDSSPLALAAKWQTPCPQGCKGGRVT
jgi:hypothetical protein